MKIVIGTRKSKLAMYQANLVREILEKIGYNIELLPIKTEGDKLKDKILTEFGGKGLFVKEIEEALLEGKCDIAVHSLKDVPYILPKGLKLKAFLKREDPRDCLVLNNGSIEKLKEGGKIGTSSLRRKVQLEKIFPKINILPIRGNVETRLRKMETEKLDGVVLALAGLKRLNLENKACHIFSPFEIIPAIGQGVIVVEGIEEDFEIEKIYKDINDEETSKVVKAERKFLEEMKGSCKIPMGGFCKKEGDFYHMVCFISMPDGSNFLKVEGIGDDPEELGLGLAENLKLKGAKEIIEKF